MHLNRSRTDTDGGLRTRRILNVDKVLLERYASCSFDSPPPPSASFTYVSWLLAPKHVSEVWLIRSCCRTQSLDAVRNSREEVSIRRDIIYRLFITLTPGDSAALRRVVTHASGHALVAPRVSTMMPHIVWITLRRQTKPRWPVLKVKELWIFIWTGLFSRLETWQQQNHTRQQSPCCLSFTGKKATFNKRQSRFSFISVS